MTERPSPFVTIAIAANEDEPRIQACLTAALGQDYPEGHIEIVVADAMSMDATREIVLLVAAEKDGRVRLLDNPERTRAAALNVILRSARGEIIVPMEPGTDYGRTHVSKCVEALSVSPAEHLAIVPRPAGRTVVERALSAVQSSKLAFAAGTDLARGVFRGAEEAAPTLLGAVRRRVFSRVGLFDPGTRCEEDVELSDRISKAGGAVLVSRDIVVHRPETASFKQLFRQHYQLGRSRARRIVKEKRLASPTALLPLAIVTAGGALALTASIQPLTPLPCVSESAKASSPSRSRGPPIPSCMRRMVWASAPGSCARW
jgi:succinoglycan biosynthesis protein ExoA